MKVYVFKVGVVPEGFVDFVLKTLNSFYGSLRDLVLSELVEVYVYGSSREKLLFLEAEARDLGVMAVGDFITLHEAWRGWPRIHVDYEKCRFLKLSYVKALLLHEAGHSVLHGSPSYYVVSIDSSLVEKFGVEKAVKIVYLASTVVKDLDVHKLLIDYGFKKYVEEYLGFLKDHQLEDVKCKNILGVLELAKVLAPCAFLKGKCRNLKDVLHETCKVRVEEVIAILEELITGYMHLNFNQKSLILAEKISKICRKTE